MRTHTATVKTISPFFDTWLQAFLVYAHTFNRSIDRPTDRPITRASWTSTYAREDPKIGWNFYGGYDSMLCLHFERLDTTRGS